MILVIKQLNPAMYLPTHLVPPDHYCWALTDELFMSQPDLKMNPLIDAENTLFMEEVTLLGIECDRPDVL